MELYSKEIQTPPMVFTMPYLQKQNNRRQDELKFDFEAYLSWYIYKQCMCVLMQNLCISSKLKYSLPYFCDDFVALFYAFLSNFRSKAYQSKALKMSVRLVFRSQKLREIWAWMLSFICELSFDRISIKIENISHSEECMSQLKD